MSEKMKKETCVAALDGAPSRDEITDAMVEAAILAAHGHAAPEVSRTHYRLAIEGALKSSAGAAVQPVALAKDGNLFWIGNPADWRGFNGNLYAAAPASKPKEPAEQPRIEEDRYGLVPLPRNLHDKTKHLVLSFAMALAAKLHAAEKKYGYSDGWQDSGWMDECRAKLLEHVAKGDPRDVAAYCAFLWFHNETTASKEPTSHIGEAGKAAEACPSEAEQLANAMQFGADMVKKYSLVCESRERECRNADEICQALGMDIEQFRTEGGSLHLPRIKNRIAELAASNAMAADTGIPDTPTVRFMIADAEDTEIAQDNWIEFEAWAKDNLPESMHEIGWAAWKAGRAALSAAPQNHVHLAGGKPEADTSLEFVQFPVEPTLALLQVLIGGNDFTADWEAGKEAQRRLGLGAVPPRAEYETAYGFYKRLIFAAQSGSPLPNTEGK